MWRRAAAMAASMATAAKKRPAGRKPGGAYRVAVCQREGGRLCSLPQRPTEHRCYILGGCSTYMQQRVRTFHRGETPSSARQLPIMAALHAEGPTLSELILHEKGRFVNPFLKNFGKTPGPLPTLPRRAESAVERNGAKEKNSCCIFSGTCYNKTRPASQGVGKCALSTVRMGGCRRPKGLRPRDEFSASAVKSKNAGKPASTGA